MPDFIDKLAQQHKLSKEALESQILELKKMGFRKLDCIRFVKYNQQISLMEAAHLVMDSPAWIEERAAFWQHQQEQWEEILSDSEVIKSINVTMSKDQTNITLNLEEE